MDGSKFPMSIAFTPKGARGLYTNTMNWLLFSFLCVCNLHALAGQSITVTPKENPLFILENTPISLTCEVRGKETNVQWTKLSRPLSEQGFEETQSLDVDVQPNVLKIVATKPEARVSDDGQYRCEAGMKVKEKTIQIFSVFIQNSNITTGNDISIKCDPELSLSQLSVRWSKDGEPLENIPHVANRVNLSDNNFTLTIKKAVLNDSGEYECKIILMEGTKSKQVFTQVAKMHGKPYFPSSETEDTVVNIGNNDMIDLYCATLGYPIPDVTWLKGDDVIQPTSRITITDHPKERKSHLKIKNANVDDVGEYVCNVENSLGRKYRKFAVSGIVGGASFLSLILLVTMVVMTTCVG